MTEEIFKPIFGDDWDKLPPVMKKHYAVCGYTDDVVTVEGTMTVQSSWLAKVLTPFFYVAGALTPYAEEDVPVTVHFSSKHNSNAFYFDRIFYFTGRRPYRFQSRMVPVGGNQVVELMRFGFGWRAAFTWTGDKVLLTHQGYVLKLGRFFLPLPLAALVGKGDAAETPIDDNLFSMRMKIRHPWWGLVYGYHGTFKVTA